jgi:hypothetical protein
MTSDVLDLAQPDRLLAAWNRPAQIRHGNSSPIEHPRIGVNRTREPITSRSVGLVEAKSGRRYQWWLFALPEVASWSCLWAANQSACCRIRSWAEASRGSP